MKKLITLTIVLLIFSFCLAEEMPLTVNGTALDKDFVNACMLLTFRSYDDTVRYYSSALGIDYWTLEYDDGSSMLARVKADGFKNLVMQTVLCSYSDELGISLDDADKRELGSLARYISEDSGMSFDSVYEALSARELAQRVYGALVSIQTIDTDSVLGSVNIDDYSHRLQYMLIPYSAYLNDTAAETAYIGLLCSLSGFNGDFSQAAKLNPDVESGEISLSELEGDLRYTALSLPETETSEVIETGFGLIVLRALPGIDNAEYENARTTALQAAREKAFQAEYEKMYRETEYTMDGVFWDSITPPALNR